MTNKQELTDREQLTAGARRPMRQRTQPELEPVLTKRDRLVLTTLARVRVATRLQLERLHFQDVTSYQAQHWLAGMVRRRLLRQVPQTQVKSARQSYVLDAAGLRIVASEQLPVSLEQPLLAQRLAVTELYVRLVEAGRLGTLSVLSFSTDPACWRSFTGLRGSRVTTLKPDAELVVERGRYEDRWFVEVDRRTEPEQASTLHRKASTYCRYWRTGIEQERSGTFPPVLWLVPNKQRKALLVDVLAQMPVEAWPLFRVVAFSEAASTIARGAHV